MALDNFIEMRDLVGLKAFRYRKMLEHALHHRFPQLCMPQYNLVSFSTQPYVEAKRRGRQMDLLIRAMFTAGGALVSSLILSFGPLKMKMTLSLVLSVLAMWRAVAFFLPHPKSRRQLSRL